MRLRVLSGRVGLLHALRRVDRLSPRQKSSLRRWLFFCCLRHINKHIQLCLWGNVMLSHLKNIIKGLGIGFLIFLITAVAVGREQVLGAIVLGAVGFLGYYFSFLYENR